LYDNQSSTSGNAAKFLTIWYICYCYSKLGQLSTRKHLQIAEAGSLQTNCCSHHLTNNATKTEGIIYSNMKMNHKKCKKQGTKILS